MRNRLWSGALVSVVLVLASCVATVTEEEVGTEGAGAAVGAGGGGSSSSGVTGTDPDAGTGGGGDTGGGGGGDVSGIGGGGEEECVPACGGRECGDDGCGGSCGSCESGATCNAGTCAAPEPTGNCPPSGSMGNRTGDIAPDMTMYDCAGNPVSTHASCGTPVYVYSHSESCGSCIYWAQSGANSFYSELQSRGVDFFFVITIGRGGTPDATLCDRVRSEYGLDMPVYFITDPWDFAESYGSVGAGPGALLDRDHRIVLRGSGKSSYDRPRIYDAADGL